MGIIAKIGNFVHVLTVHVLKFRDKSYFPEAVLAFVYTCASSTVLGGGWDFVLLSSSASSNENIRSSLALGFFPQV